MEDLKRLEAEHEETSGDRRQRAEILLRFLDAARGIEPFRGKKLDEIFSDEKHVREFIEHLSAEEFSRLLDGLNGILRGKKKEEWGMDGATVGLKSAFLGIGYLPPRHEDKPALLAEVLAAAQGMSRSGRKMEDIALLFASSLNAIHPYLDGNGRSSRTLYTILTKGFGEEAKRELTEVLLEYGKDKINLNPGFIESKLDDLVEREVGIHDSEQNPEGVTKLYNYLGQGFEFDPHVSESDGVLFQELVRKDTEYMFWSVFSFFRDNPETDIAKCIEKFPQRTVISVDTLVKNINSEELHEILCNYRKLKVRYVEKLIGSIADPDNEEYRVEKNGQTLSLKAYFENKIRDEQQKRAEEEREARERVEAEEREKQHIEEKEKTMKARFENGEGSYREFASSELPSISDLERRIMEIAEADFPEYAKEEKLEMLKKSLFDMARNINDEVTISQEWIDAYVESKKSELLHLVQEFKTVSDIMDVLESSGAFAYKIHTSSDYEIPYSDQAYLDKHEDISSFLDELFSQSVYYVSPNGASLRLRLFDIKSKKLSEVVQRPMEQIFYNDDLVDYAGKQVVAVSDISPERKKFVFEISSPGFDEELLRESAPNRAVKSGIATIRDEEGLYVNIPNGSTLHSGWRIVGVTKLQQHTR